MSRKWIVALVLLAAASVAVAREAFVRPDSAEEIKAIEDQWAKAYVAKDAAFFDKLCVDDYTFVEPDGGLSGKKDDQEALKSGALAFESMRMSEVKVRVWGDCAVATGMATIKGKVGGQDVSGNYRFTDTFVKKDGAWRAVAGQATRITGK